MTTIHLISHTHWDREWYLPFQVFRLKLVHLIDNLLAILNTVPDYRYFMLDGQTIVLEDYLELKPELEKQLNIFIRSGRILIGPWYVLPDEFLVSPEAIVRNLLVGKQICEKFGSRMMVGYIPDPFGHIGQMPQILRGFGIHTASFMRGLGDEPCEIWWESPDGSRVLMAYLRDGYGNAANLPYDSTENFRIAISQNVQSLKAHSVVDHVLLMNGTDHTETSPLIPDLIADFNKTSSVDRLVHSTLPIYLQSILEEIQSKDVNLLTYRGEARQSKRTPLLPGVLSSRVWIKQRNHTCESQLERWAEPFSAWASQVAPIEKGVFQSQSRITDPAPLIRYAWKLLMQNHPHDSICGCSIDQVHEEMRSRFDQVEQVARQVSEQSLQAIARQIETEKGAPKDAFASMVVFNASPFPQTGIVETTVYTVPGINNLKVVCADGQPLICQISNKGREEFAKVTLDRQEVARVMGMIQDGRVEELNILDLDFKQEANQLFIDLILCPTYPPNKRVFQEGIRKFHELYEDERFQIFHIYARSPEIKQIRWIAWNVPGVGYKTFWCCDSTEDDIRIQKSLENVIENEFLKVTTNPDGTFDLLDKRNNRIFHRLHRLVDGGDAGDEYNYNPPYQDRLIQARLMDFERLEDGLTQTITLSYTLDLPSELSTDRSERSNGITPCIVKSSISLMAGVARVDIKTEINNQVKDHRLRVHFATSLDVQTYYTDGHFDVVQRTIENLRKEEGWVEQPYQEVPQMLFTDVNNGDLGLMVASKGLREVQVLRNEKDQAEIAITLLRCVGWLSRDDLPLRPGHAGPGYATPGAQQIGVHNFEYSIIPHQSSWEQAVDFAYGFDLGMQGMVTPVQHGKLPIESQMIRVDSNRWILSTIKQSEDSKGWVVRGYNPTDCALDLTLIPYAGSNGVELVTFDENPIEDLPLDRENRVRIKVKPRQITTVKFGYT